MPDSAEQEDEVPVTSAFAVDDHIRPRLEQRSVRALPRLVAGAVRLAWRAGQRDLIVAISTQAVAGAGVFVQILAARAVLDAIVQADREGGGYGAVVPSVAMLLAAMLVVALAGALQNSQTLVLGERVAHRAADELLEVSAAVDLQRFEVPEFHNQLERAKFNANARPLTAIRGLVGAVSGAMSAAGAAVALLAIEPLVLAPAALGVLPLWLANSRNSRAFYVFTRDMTAKDRERTYLLNVLSNKELAKEVRAFDLAGHLRERHNRLFGQRLGLLRQVARARLRLSMAAASVGAAFSSAAIAVVVWLLATDRMTLADAGAAILGLLYLTQRLQSLALSVSSLYEAGLFIDDLTSFRERYSPAARGEAVAARPAPTGFERLVAERVGYVYEGATRPAVNDVNLELRRGEVVALVGENGSGKTTLAKILAGLYPPTAGRVLWDGIDVSTFDAAEVRRSIAVLFQDFARYEMTVYDNIAMGRVERIEDTEAVAAAAEAGQADGFVARLPRGYDTLLSRRYEGGRDLSIGQWQRLAQARAFFRDSPFVIMDEPTASLDPIAEFRLFERVRLLCRGRAVLLISHRFSSVGLADRIYVMRAGGIAEHGTHAELMARKGLYAEMFTLQAAAFHIPT